jgi:uncharacterized metal-binding protein YceD (DUF177 family)
MKNTLELSRVVALATLKEQRYYTTHFESNAEENVALAKRYEILEVKTIEADIKIRNLGEGRYRVQAHYKAEIVQACGLTLEPVVEFIDDSYEEILTTRPEDVAVFDEEEIQDADAATELITGDEIDYGEIVVQLVALSLNPFPRAVPQGEALFAHVEHQNNPFAVLSHLQADRNKKS